MSAAEQLFPRESEQGVLGGLLIDNTAWQRIAGVVGFADFFHEAHRAIFVAIGALIESGKPADTITVAEELQTRGDAELVAKSFAVADDTRGPTAADVLRALVQPLAGAGSIVRYSEVVREYAQRRAVRYKLDAAPAKLKAVSADLAEGKLSAAQAAQAFADLAVDLEAGGGPRHGPAFKVVPVGDVLTADPPAPALWWGPWLPAGVVTHFAAHGGAGKSTIALMLAVSIAAGRPLFGIPARSGRVAFYSAEDTAAVVRHRLANILRGLDIDPSEIDGRLHTLDATDGDPVLYREVTAGGMKSGCMTPAYAELRRYVEDNAIDVLMIDNASDVFDCSEIDRARVRGFMRALAGIAKERDRAVLLLGHVDKATSRGERSGTEGYSGSTAWHNSARSRWFMARDKEGILELAHQKHNLTKQADPLRLMWPAGGIPRLEYVPSGFVQGIRDRADAKPLLKLIHEFAGRGEFVSTADVGPATAHAKLSGEPGFPTHLKKPADTFSAIRDAQRRGLLTREWHRTKDRKDKEHWSLTLDGLALIGASAPVAPVAPVPAIGGIGAAAEPAAPIAPVPAHRGCGGELERTTGAAS